MSENPAPIAPIPGTATPGSANPVNVSGANSPHTTFVPKAHGKSVDPAYQPYGNRTYAPKERCGACYGIQVGFEAHQAPEAGATQGMGRVFQSAVNRTAPNFAQGMQGSY
jgi:hypothetical protein